MIKIKYVGAKTDGERAFQEHTGREWFPGDVHEVTPEHAGMMLRHPDVFAQADEGQTVTLAQAKPSASGNPVSDQEADDEMDAHEAAARVKAEIEAQQAGTAAAGAGAADAGAAGAADAAGTGAGAADTASKAAAAAGDAAQDAAKPAAKTAKPKAAAKTPKAKK